MKRFAHLAVTFLLAIISAAALAHVAHYNLGLPGSLLREQALICAALISGVVTIEFLASKE